MAFDPIFPSNSEQNVSPYAGGKSAVGSPYIRGSYSGADVKVVVNLPVNTIALESETQRTQSQINYVADQLRVAQQSHDIAKQTSGGYYKNIQATQTRIDNLQSQYNELLKRRDLLGELLPEVGDTISKPLATLQTLSWSIFREKVPVRFLGSNYARAYVRGPRTIAGSMVFTMFDEHALQGILNWGLSPYSTGHVESDHDYYRNSTFLIDQLPPLDITILFANEYGMQSYMNLWGVEFLSEGGTFSIEDLFSESVVQYIARDIDPIRKDLQRKTDIYTNVLTGKIKPKTASQLRLEDLEKGGRAVTKKRNPYI
jgi:hypothetical protein